ncbi:hypothetical protein Tco_0976502 [Tanacetum coccineum]|uniref:Uncharacterized protein n=1 Tax=Tanacetum coccineum TaxID=301880 RepID=A0ABQ5EHG9_9ASTR
MLTSCASTERLFSTSTGMRVIRNLLCVFSATVAVKAVTLAKAITESIHRAEICDIKGLLDEGKDNIRGMKIVRDPSVNTLRVSQSMVYNGDCVVEKNDKWSYTYPVGSQVYQGVCTRSDIESADVVSSKAKLRHTGAFSTTEAEYMTLTGAVKESIWLKGLSIVSGAMIRSVAVNATTGAFIKTVPILRF